MIMKKQVHAIRHQHRPTRNLAGSFVSPCPLRIHLYVIHNTYIYIIYYIYNTYYYIILILFVYIYSSYIHSSSHDYIT